MKEYFLKELLEIKNGKDHKNENKGVYPVYGSGGIMRYIDNYLYDDESILLPRKGTLSNIQYVKEKFWTVDTTYYTVLNKEKAIPYYLYYYLRLLDLSNLNSGTGVPSMTFNSYYQIKVKLPNLSTQQKIASILSALDNKIELNHQINATLEEMAKTIYDYWFVQFDFPNKEGKPYKSSGGKMVYNKKLKREIPEGWEVKKLKELLFEVKDNIKPTDYKELPYLPIDKMPLKSLYYFEYENRIKAKSSLIRFLEDDILIGAMRVYFHRVCNAISNGISRSTMMVLRPFEKTHKNFLLFTINRSETIKYASDFSTGSPIPYAKWESSLETFPLSFSNNENIFKKFNKLIDPIIEEFKINNNQNQELASLRDWLLPLLMNGQVAVETAEKKVKEKLKS